MKLDSFLPGMVVFDVGRTKMGNTTMTTVSVWPVKIISVDTVNRTVTASWNGNSAKVFYARTYSKWRKSEPVLIRTGIGRRLARREEIRALTDNKEA